MRLYVTYCLLAIGSVLSVYASTPVLLVEKPSRFPPGMFVLDSAMDTIRVDEFMFYMSHIRAWKKGVPVKTNGKDVLLVSFTKSEKVELPFDSSLEIDSIGFTLGTDSLANVSGAMSGDLDPSHGMYWAWHSGYIHLKIEGRSSRYGNIEWHLGGYQQPYGSAQEIMLHVSNNSVCVRPEILFSALQEGFPQKEMTPSKNTIELMKRWKKAFGVCGK